MSPRRKDNEPKNVTNYGKFVGKILPGPREGGRVVGQRPDGTTFTAGNEKAAKDKLRKEDDKAKHRARSIKGQKKERK